MRGMRTMDAQQSSAIFPRPFVAPGTTMIRPLLLKPQWMNGLTERLLVSHYVNNYGGALRRLNAIRAHLATFDWARTSVFEINGLKREELIAASSVILHEVYFESLGGSGDNPPDALADTARDDTVFIRHNSGDHLSVVDSPRGVRPKGHWTARQLLQFVAQFGVSFPGGTICISPAHLHDQE